MTDKDSYRGIFRIYRSALPEKDEELKEIEASLLEQLEHGGSESRSTLLQSLVLFYSQTNRQKTAAQYAEQLAHTAKDPEEQAKFYLLLGQLMEQIRDYESALTYYSEAYTREPKEKTTWYLINNNLGYCLNHFGRFIEAEPYCRSAIKIDPDRFNAYKNLGVALEGQGQFAEAALYYHMAVRANVADPRALRHLERIVADHPEISGKIPDIYERLRSSQEAVAKIQSDMAALIRKSKEHDSDDPPLKSTKPFG